LAVPAEDRRRLDEEEAGSPLVPDRAKPSPEKAIRRSEFGPLHGALQNSDLMAEGQDLPLQRCAAPEGREQRGQER
jgi:hypothetical protein